MHKSRVLHNDLSPRNILFHFPNYSNEEINIGICDWGISSRFDEKAPSHYGKPTEELTERDAKGRWWVAPELFYTYGPPNSDTSIPIMQAKHRYTEESDSYSIGKLTEWMKIEDMVHDWDTDLFNKYEASKYLATKLKEMREVDPGRRPTCTEVANQLINPQWCMRPLEFLFRSSLN